MHFQRLHGILRSVHLRNDTNVVYVSVSYGWLDALFETLVEFLSAPINIRLFQEPEILKNYLATRKELACVAAIPDRAPV